VYRPLPRCNPPLLIWLWGFWITLVLCGFLLWMIYNWSQRANGLSILFRYLLRPESSQAKLLILTPIGIILGAVHSSVLRSLPATEKKRFRGREMATVWVITLVLAGIPGWVRYRAHREAELHMHCRGGKLYYELESLMAAGDVKATVRRMEQGCEMFREAKAKLGDKFVNRMGGHGWSYLYNTLHTRQQQTCLEQNVAGGMLDFLLCVKYDRHRDNQEIGAYGAWHPLAEEMSRSSTPILKIIGFHLLEEKAAFAEAVYAEFDEGNDSLEPLAVFAATYSDPDPVRARARLRALGVTSAGS
jgi:hypothetical protein